MTPIDDFTKEQLANFGKRLREFRKAKGFSNQEHFAFRFDIPRAQYSRYERGGNITFVSLLRILRILEVPLEEFFKEGFDPYPDKDEKSK